jgi:hypothetical protein
MQPAWTMHLLLLGDACTSIAAATATGITAAAAATSLPAVTGSAAGTGSASGCWIHMFHGTVKFGAVSSARTYGSLLLRLHLLLCSCQAQLLLQHIHNVQKHVYAVLQVTAAAVAAEQLHFCEA